MPIIKPVLGDDEIQAVADVLKSGWVTQGPRVAEFEKQFASFTGAGFAVAVSNCTAALHLALKAVGVRADDEVITVSHSYIATANSIRYCNAIPVFVDIDPLTFNLDPNLVENAISDRTRAILCVHQMGMPCDLTQIKRIADERSLPLIEDAACAVGSEILLGTDWEMIGKPCGDIACFSFHPRKLLTTGDGGMLTTDNKEHDIKFRLWRQHSMSISDTIRHDSKDVRFESYPELGYNYRMTDIQAAVGIAQLRRIPGIIKKRRDQVHRYRELLEAIPGLILPYEPEWARSNWQSFCVRLPGDCNQAHVMQYMLDAGISTRRGIMCAHREPAYKLEPWRCRSGQMQCDTEPSRCDALRQSERAQEEAIILPLYYEMSDQDIETVAATLKEACTISTD